MGQEEGYTFDLYLFLHVGFRSVWCVWFFLCVFCFSMMIIVFVFGGFLVFFQCNVCFEFI